jgi:hypothetical protein
VTNPSSRNMSGVTQPGRALGSGARDRGFLRSDVTREFTPAEQHPDAGQELRCGAHVASMGEPPRLLSSVRRASGLLTAARLGSRSPRTHVQDECSMFFIHVVVADPES